MRDNTELFQEEIDEIIFLDINQIYNEDSFKQTVLSIISRTLKNTVSLSDKKHINHLITTEYFKHHNYR